MPSFFIGLILSFLQGKIKAIEIILSHDIEHMIKLYNTLTGKKEKFKEIKKGEVGVYSCGPTVYDFAHIGNLRSYIFADILVRVLRYNGFEVKWVINITDVGHLTSDADVGEEKMEKGALREKKTVGEIAEFYTNAFKSDLKKIGVQSPDVWPKATEHIKEQIALIKKLEKKGVVYKTADGIYFDTSKIKDYGKLSRMDLTKIEAGKRVDLGGKKNATDFALWKFSPKDKKREMEWDSPWGVGFPGWHIECSAMSMKYLGETFDIHTGGIDHIPIHHTNEIAQSETATGKPFVNYWMHGEFLILGDKEKMAKSGENFITMQNLIEKGFNPLAYRYLTFLTHYRKQLRFSWDGVKAAQNALYNLYGDIKEIISKKSFNEGVGKIDESSQKKFLEKINNDLDMPGAIALVFEILHSKKISDEDKYETLLDFDDVLGLDLDKVEKEELPPPEIEYLAEQRLKARRNKDWEQSDKLREEISEKGWTIEDLGDNRYLIKSKS